MDRDYEDYINYIRTLRAFMTSYHENAIQSETVATKTGQGQGQVRSELNMPAERNIPSERNRRSRKEYEFYDREDTVESVEELRTTRQRLYSIITEFTRENMKLNQENGELKKEKEEMKVKKGLEKTRTDT